MNSNNLPKDNNNFQNKNSNNTSSMQIPNQSSNKIYLRPKSVSDSINPDLSTNNTNNNIFPSHQDKENFYPQAADMISRKFNSPGPSNSIPISQISHNSTSSTSSRSQTSLLYSKFGPKPVNSQTLLFYFGKKDFKPPTRQECGDDPAQLHPKLIQTARQCSFDLIQKTVAKTCLFTVRSSQVRLFYRISASSIEHIQIGFKNIVAVDSLEKSWLNIVTKSAKTGGGGSGEVSYAEFIHSIKPF